LFHNLRSTRHTELAEKFPLQVVCGWIGNTRAVAQDHYLQVTDAHFAHAVAEPAAEAAQNPAQSASETVGNGRKSESDGDENGSEFPMDSEPCGAMQEFEIAATGLEPVTRGL
jgi:hypothetical protein